MPASGPRGRSASSSSVTDSFPDAERTRGEEPMRLGLIGSAGHWHTYAPALQQVPGLSLVAVAAAGPEETTGAFDHAPGLTIDTRRYDDARKMLETERL